METAKASKSEALAALEELYLIQKSRIERLHSKMDGEDIMPSLRTEINRAWRMLDDIAELQVDMGILEKNPLREKRAALYVWRARIINIPEEQRSVIGKMLRCITSA